MRRKLDLKTTKTLKNKQQYFKSNRRAKHDKLNSWGAISHRSKNNKKVIFKDGFLNKEIFQNNVSIKSSYDLDK